MSEYDIAIKIAGKLESSFKGAIAGAKSGLSGLGISGKAGALALKGVGVAAKATAAAVAGAGAAVAGLGAYAMNVGKDFESQMSTVAAISGATGEEMEILSNKAKEMGATTSFSASEAGQAMEYMAMAGWKTEDMVGGISGIMNLAAASGEDLALTSDIVTDALTAFGLSASDSSHFADILAAASSNANTNVSMLGESFKYAAPVAGSLGISAEDTSIALGLMANAGIKASSAGTALRTGLTNLAKPTKQMQAYMDRYNIALVENADGSINLRGTMMDLRTKMAGLSESEQAAAAAAIFGKNSMAGWLAVVNSSDQDFGKLAGAIDECNGKAEEMAAIKLDNLEGDITLLKSTVEGFGISIYENLQGPFRDVVQYGRKQIESLKEALDSGGFEGLAKQIGVVLSDAVTKIAEKAPDFINGAASLVESLVQGLDDNSSAIGEAIGRLITALGAAIIRLAPRIAVTAIHILLAIGKGIIDNLDVLKDAAIEAVEYLWNAIKDGFKKFKDFLGDDEIEPFKKVLALLPVIIGGFAIFDGIGGTIKGFVSNFKGAGKAMPGAAKMFSKAGSSMSKVAKNFLGVGAGLLMAAAGIWILVEAAERISQASPEAVTALIIMAAAIAGLLIVVTVMGQKLKGAAPGLLAFGGAILMAAGGMLIMAFAATMLGNAGTGAMIGLGIMIGGMIALLAIAGSMGTQLAAATPGLLAFGGAILMAAGGMLVMALAATMLSNAGLGAMIMFGVMLAAMIALMAIAGSLGPALIVAGIGMLLLGTGVLIAAAGMMILVLAAIMLNNAGMGAIGTLVALVAIILAFGLAAGLLAPLLMLAGAGLAVFGAGLMVVALAAVMAAGALLIISLALPSFATYGMAAAAGIMAVGAAIGLLGIAAVAGAAGVGMAALAFTGLAGAALLAMLPMMAIGAAFASIGMGTAVLATAGDAASDSLNKLMSYGSSATGAMTGLASALALPAAPLMTLAQGLVQASTGASSLAAGILATDGGLALMLAALIPLVALFTALNAVMNTLILQASLLVKAVNIIGQALTQLGTLIAPAASLLATLSAPMDSAMMGALKLAAGLKKALVQVMALTRTLTGLSFVTAAAVVAFTALTNGVKNGMKQANAAVKSAMSQMRAIMLQGMAQIVMAVTMGFVQMVAVVHSAGAQMVAAAAGTAMGIRAAFNIDLYSAGAFMMQGLLNGMLSMKAQVEQAATEIAQKAAQAVNNALQVKSPSRLMIETGQFTGEGLAIGMQNRKGDIATAAQSMTSPVQDQAQQMRDMSAPQPMRSGIIGETLSDLQGGTTTNNTTNQTQAPTFNFNPTYVIEGNADQDTLTEANRMSQAEFERMANEWIRNNGRTAFA